MIDYVDGDCMSHVSMYKDGSDWVAEVVEIDGNVTDCSVSIETCHDEDSCVVRFVPDDPERQFEADWANEACDEFSFPELSTDIKSKDEAIGFIISSEMEVYDA